MRTLRAADSPHALSPRESLAHFQLDEGLAIELVACEPQVVDPIAIRFDEDGRLWVVEMRDYPHGPPSGEPPLSKIRVLDDTDFDGHYETSQVFADELLFPTGLQPWRGGVIVTLAGEVAYLKDTNGDGHADQHETWYRGFAQENPQLRANHPRFGYDGRIHIANGLRGGAVVDVRRPDNTPKPLSISGRDFAFDPKSGAIDATSGNGQFGLTFDDFGNRFVCNNRAPLQHVVLDNRYTARNPFAAISSVVQDVAAAGERSRVFPLTDAWTTSNLHAGQFTAACGVTIFRGNALGADYQSNAFVCEPTGSLVHREIVTPSGATFTSRAAHSSKEFLASPDPWFRPVNLQIGPDGALYVVDMSRAVIEHPQFMPSELQKRPDLRDGDDRGRIYRIVRADRAARRNSPPALSQAASANLVETLHHENGWWRDTAARLLIERDDRSVSPELEKVARSASRCASRVAALWVLSRLGALSTDLIAVALTDSDPQVRQHGVLLAEPRLANEPPLRTKVIAAAEDNDAGVRFRVALAAGGLDASADALAALRTVALRSSPDQWTRAALCTALPTHVGPLLTALLDASGLRAERVNAEKLTLVGQLATILGASQRKDDVATVLDRITDDADSSSAAARETALLGLARGLDRRGAALATFVDGLSDGTDKNHRLEQLFARVGEEVAGDALSESARVNKIGLLAFDRSPRTVAQLLSMVEKSGSQRTRIAAAQALAGQTSPRIGPELLEGFASQSPAVRRAILDALVARKDRAGLLLDNVEAGRIARVEIDPARAGRLHNHADPEVRARAKTVLAQPLPEERKRVLARYQPALSLEGDPISGRKLFRQHCSTCHRIAGIGVDVAPDISDSRVKTPEQLFVDILNPNQAIDNNYVSYSVVMADGTVHTGIVAAETAASITLRQPEDKRVDLLRADIETMRTTGKSLMPEGLENQLTQQQLADVISFVKNWRYLETSIPGTLSSDK